MDNTIEIWSPQHLKQILKSDEDFGKEFEDIMNTDDAIC
jgi:MraZ protein